LNLSRHLKLFITMMLLSLITSIYILWEIDRHEKALLGEAYLIPVPRLVWYEYIDDLANNKELEIEFSKDDRLTSILKQHKTIEADTESPQIKHCAQYNIIKMTNTNIIPQALRLHNSDLFRLWLKSPDDYQYYGYIVRKFISTGPLYIPFPNNPSASEITSDLTKYHMYFIISCALCLFSSAAIVKYFIDKTRDTSHAEENWKWN